MSTLEQSLNTLEDNLKSRYKGLILWTSFLSEGDEYHAPIVRIMTIQIPSENRKQGLGSEVMSQIISWADDHGVMLSLSPTTDFGASSVSRLTKFYRRFGFKPNKGRNKDFRTRDTMLRNPSLRKKSKLKNTGHGGGKPDDRATWGDWIATTPIKHTVKKENGESKTYEAGDIVGPCAISSEPSWRSVTDGGNNPLKCMPRDKAHDLTKKQRATLARKKRREEAKSEGQKPVLTPTFSEEGKDMIKDKLGARPIRIDKRPLRELTEQAWGVVMNRAEKATEKGVSTISQAHRFPHFIAGKINIGDESVYVTVEIDEERAGSAVYIPNDHHIIIQIKDYPANLSHPLTRKYTNYEANFKRDFLSLLEHEVTHAYDKIFYNKNLKRTYRKEKKTRSDYKRYVNSRAEVKAFLQQIASQSEAYLRKNYGLSRESIRDHFMEALTRSTTYKHINRVLTPKSLKYIKSAVITHLLDQVV